MDKIIKYHFNKAIKDQIRLSGGYTFQTWLLTLSDNQKVVFRAQKDFKTSGGRDIVIADVLEREKYFYNRINREVGRICPEVYVVDGTHERYDMSYCIMEYIEGTPLALCFDNFGIRIKNDVLYKIGEISAKFNSIEIEIEHPYIKSRCSWEDYIASRIQERLAPLVKNDVITHDEIIKITDGMRRKKAEKTLSFLHLDMRRINMIYNNGNIFILDAENCEFGDPLFELATIDVAGELAPALIEGYKNTYRGNIDLNNELYYYYKMERNALVLDLFINEVKYDKESTQHYLSKFCELKRKLLM